ncbi:CPBP family intramembrane metalloprotease [Gordonia terrae]|uniref:CPBP family intramembrane metalloprotease n=1 Tax=Gordonia terrae TaxID=2055 RepID=A0AAD0K9B5_9ACTN|nr:abortive infection protein [Gordonia terrae]AWO82757.1 CPBP family intramembrane metalloprotease [Gordonia terrae]
MNLTSSPLVHDATTGRRRPHLILVWVVALVAIVGGQVVGAAIANAITGSGMDGSVAAQWNEVITNGMTLVVLFAWVVAYERRSILSVGLRDRRGPIRFLVGAASGFALFGIVLLLLVVFAGYDADSAAGHTTTGTAAVGIVLSLIPVWIVQASTEEIAVRGYLLQWHGLRLTNGWAAVILPSILFAVVHLDFHPLVLVNIFLFGVLFSFLSLGSGSIWLTAELHAAWNMAQGNIFGILGDSSARDVTVFTFASDTSASSVLTGGDYGPEGSALTTIVLTFAVVASYRYYRRMEATRIGVSAAENDTVSGSTDAR